MLLALALSTFGLAAMAQEEVTVEVTGEIAASCGLVSPTAPVDLGWLHEKTSHRFSIGIDCNHPFALALQSRHGGLRHEGGLALASVATNGGSGEFLPYAIDISLPLEDGDTDRIAQTCASDSIREGGPGCAIPDSGTAIALGQTLDLELRWQQGGTPLAGGRFVDTLTFTLSVRP